MKATHDLGMNGSILCDALHRKSDYSNVALCRECFGITDKCECDKQTSQKGREGHD